MHKLAIFLFVVACVAAPVLIVKLSTFLANAAHIYKKRRKDWTPAVSGPLGDANWLPEVTCFIPSIPPEKVQISKDAAAYWKTQQTQAVHPNFVVNSRVSSQK
jgi:hypothetical protein